MTFTCLLRATGMVRKKGLGNDRAQQRDVIAKVDELMVMHMRLHNWHRKTGRSVYYILPVLGSCHVDWMPSKLVYRSTVAANKHIYLQDMKSACIFIEMAMIREPDDYESERGTWYPRGGDIEEYENGRKERLKEYENGRKERLKDNDRLVEENERNGQFDQREQLLYPIHAAMLWTMALVAILVMEIIFRTSAEPPGKGFFGRLGFFVALLISSQLNDDRCYQKDPVVRTSPRRFPCVVPHYELGRWLPFRATKDDNTPVPGAWHICGSSRRRRFRHCVPSLLGRVVHWIL
jgi:hypothetical protein